MNSAKNHSKVVLIIIVFFPLSLWAQVNAIFRSDWHKVAAHFDFPEGPAWNGHGLYLSNCYSDWIAYLHDNQVDTVRVNGIDSVHFVRTNGLVFHEGRLYACDFGLKRVLRIEPDGKSVSLTNGIRLTRPNDLTFDKKGNLYFTDSGTYRRESPDGKVYRWEPWTGKVITVLENLAFPNGVAFSPDGKFLYISESAYQAVVRFPVTCDDKFGVKETVVVMPGGDPDGLAFDAIGNLYVAHFGGGALWVIAPDGAVLAKLKTPGRKPSNLEFGGNDLLMLFLTEVETNCLYQISTHYPGFLIK